MGFLGNKMGFAFQAPRFLVLFLLLLVSFFSSQVFVSRDSDQRGVVAMGKVRFVVGFEKGHYLSSSMGPVAAPSPSPAMHSKQQASPPSQPPRFPLLLTHKFKREDESQTKRALIMIALSVGSGCVFCGIGVLCFLGCRKMRKQKRRKRRRTASATVSSILQSKMNSDPVYKYGQENGLDSSDCSSGEIDEVSVSGVCESRIDVADEDQDDSISSSDESFYSLNRSPPVSESSQIAVQENQLKGSHCPPPPPPPPPLRPPLPVETPESKTISSYPRFPPPPPPPPAPRNYSPGIPPPPPPLPRNYSPDTPAPPPPPPQNYSPETPPPPPPFRGIGTCSLPKLKPLHWDKVRAASNRSTVWDKLRSSSFEFDEEMIESLFSYNILDPKRLHNITILSKALNASSDQVCAAIIQGEGLSLQDLEALWKMAPTKEEAEKLEDFKGDLNELGSAERLVKAMLHIPYAFSKIEAMFFRETFEEEVVHLRRSFSMLEEACTELRSSRLFLKLLEAVLKTGNRMNVGTIRGGAKAFKLDALLKLADVKGADGKTTLLHFVVQEIIRSEGLRMSESIMGRIHQRASMEEDKEEKYRKMGLEIVSSLSTELCNAKKTASLDLDVLAGSVANLSNGVDKIRALIMQDVAMAEQGFQRSMSSFLKRAESKLNEVNEDEKRVLSHVREMTEYFHGDVGKDETNPLRIFVIVRDFLNMLDQVCKELRNIKSSRILNPLSPF